MSGRRELKTDEKSFVAEIARSFHIERAVNKAAQIEKRNNTNNNDKKPSSESQQTSLSKKKRRARRKSGGGSVWITLKGGFASVPTALTNGEEAAKVRGERSEQCLVKAVAVAEEYMKSARDQAAAAGLHYTGETAAHAKLASSVSPSTDSIDYTEGDAYLREQHAIAALGVKKALKTPCGAHLRSLLGASSSSASGAVLPPSFASREAREAFEDAVVAAKKFIGAEEDDTAVEVDALRAPFYFSLQQQQDSQLPAGKGNNGNTLCIVRSKVSGVSSSVAPAKDESKQLGEEEGKKKKQKARKSKEERGKKNTIIFRTKSKAEAFVQSLMNNVIRKEMSGAMRIRDGTGVEPATAPTTTSSSTTQNQNNKGSAKGKKGRR